MARVIIQWNCRGVRANLNEIHILGQIFSITALCLQETYLADCEQINFKHYTHYSKCQPPTATRPQGGVSILVNNMYPHSKIQLSTPLQAVAMRISLHKTISLCSLYLPPNSPFLLNELNDLISQLPKPVVLMGDFNAHSQLWGCRALDARGKTVEDFIAHNNLLLMNNKSSTYIHPATGTATSIDLTICDPRLDTDFKWSVHDDLCGSDHLPVLLEDNVPFVYQVAQQWKLRKADWTAFKALCNQMLTADTLTACDMKTFTSTLTHIASQTIPKTTKTSTRIKKPWYNDTCKAAVCARKRALHVFKTHPTPDNLSKLKISRAKARHTIRQTKRQSWQTYVSSLNARAPAKKLWSMVHKISGKMPSTTIHHLLDNNNTHITDITDITNLLGKTFADASSTKHYTTNFLQVKTRAESKPLSFSSDNSEVYNLPLTVTELNDALHNVNESSPGPDNIHYQFLKQLPEKSLQLLLNIFNNIYNNGIFPPIWQQATVIPVPKPDKDHTDASNYRPIALTSCLCKTMERMVNNRLIYYLERNQCISEFQSGFRKERSTTDHLVRLESFIREGLANDEHVVALFFDLEKAYDTSWRHGILLDLFRVGLRGHLPNFVSKFLENRQFRVRIGSTYSSFFDQEVGVPQGSVLSVTLFNLRINSIVNCLVPGVEPFLYVDDFAACCRSRQMRTIERRLQLSLNKLEKWTNEEGFKFSQTKTVCVHFCHRRRIHPDPNLSLFNHDIPVVTETKFLGVIFDQKLNFIPHLRQVRTKCSKAMNLLKVLAHRDWGADIKTMLKIYRSTIRSKLDYGCVVYGCARKSYTQMLDPIQNQALHLCLGAFRTSPVESLQIETNEVPLSLRRDKLALQYAVRLRSNARNPTTSCMLNVDVANLFNGRPKLIQPFSLRVKHLLDRANIDFNITLTSDSAAIPPWIVNIPVVDLSLHTLNKSLINPNLLKTKFLWFTAVNHGAIQIFTDGSKDVEAVSSAMVCGKKTVTLRLPSTASVFTAEAYAICLALQHVEASHERTFIIFSDSLSCLQAILHCKWQNAVISKILEKLHLLSSLHKVVKFCWVPSHIGIQGNEAADIAAKAALKSPVVAKVCLPYTDFKQYITAHVTTTWQTTRNAVRFNKLKEIKRTIGTTKVPTAFTRREEVVLHRIRIGHTHITHSYLLKHENPPECSHCKCLLTVKHILVECPVYNSSRTKHYRVTDLQQLFSTVHPSHIINYLKEINLYTKL